MPRSKIESYRRTLRWLLPKVLGRRVEIDETLLRRVCQFTCKLADGIVSATEKWRKRGPKNSKPRFAASGCVVWCLPSGQQWKMREPLLFTRATCHGRANIYFSDGSGVRHSDCGEWAVHRVLKDRPAAELMALTVLEKCRCCWTVRRKS